MSKEDLKHQIKILKDRIKKKTERIKQLNKNTKRITKDLIDTQQERRIFKSKYLAIKQVLPLKCYKITYLVKEHFWDPEEISRPTDFIMASHFKEAIINIKVKNIENYVEILDILEVAS